MQIIEFRAQFDRVLAI